MIYLFIPEVCMQQTKQFLEVVSGLLMSVVVVSVLASAFRSLRGSRNTCFALKILLVFY
jgi:hypothetical protein